MHNWFAELSAVDVSAHVKQKNGMNYLSWMWAWAELKKRYPLSYSTVHETEDGMLVASKGNPGKAGVGGTMNTPGNSIDGNVSESISILRFNSAVSRRKLGDTPENEGVLMSTIVSNILGT